MQLPIANGFYKSDSLPISHQECVNLYPNIVQAAGLGQETLFSTPGITQLTTAGDYSASNRGSHVVGGIPYFVQGAVLYKLVKVGIGAAATFSLSSIGAISGAGRVSMADNGTQLMVLVPGGDGYIYNISTSTLSQITDSDFAANGNPRHVVYIDGYFLATTDSKKFIISALNDGTSWNALDFGTAEADPDDIVAPIVFNNELFIAGSETIEGFQNQPNGADFPFRRTGLYIPKGLSSAFSFIRASNTFMFVGKGVNESPSVWAFNGSGVDKVSTTAIDAILHGLNDEQVSNITAWTYAQKGAFFVGFTLPSTCLVYDTISGRWQERKSRVPTASGEYNTETYRVASLVQAYGSVICGDLKDGRIGGVDPDELREYGHNIIRRFSTQPLAGETKAFTVPRIELTIESGTGNTLEDDPVITLQLSRNGRTWTDGRVRKMGKIGDYGRRCIWRRNGRIPRFCSFRFTMTDPVKLVGIRLDAEIA